MEVAYRADAWQALYTTVAAAAATLTSLLFVALSLDLPAILRHPGHLVHAREALGGLLSVLVLSVLVLVPGQDRRALGAERSSWWPSAGRCSDERCAGWPSSGASAGPPALCPSGSAWSPCSAQASA